MLQKEAQEILTAGYLAGYMEKEAGFFTDVASSIPKTWSKGVSKSGLMLNRLLDKWRDLSSAQRQASIIAATATGGAGVGALIDGWRGSAIGGGIGAGVGAAGSELYENYRHNIDPHISDALIKGSRAVIPESQKYRMRTEDKHKIYDYYDNYINKSDPGDRTALLDSLSIMSDKKRLTHPPGNWAGRR